MQKPLIYLAIIVFLTLMALSHFWHGSVDALQRLALTRSLIFQRSVVTPEYGPVKYSPLQSLGMIPTYLGGYLVGRAIGRAGEEAHRVAYRACAALFNPVIVTLLCVLYFRILVNMGLAVSPAFLSTFLLLFGTLLLPYARIMFSEPLSALLILTVAGLLIPFPDSPSAWRLLGIFLSLGLLCMNGMVFYPFYFLVFLFLIFSLRRRKQSGPARNTAVLGLLVLLLTFLAWGHYNHARYGSFTATGYEGEGFNHPLFIGAYGLLFSIGRGLLFFSPLTVLSLVFLSLRGDALDPSLRPALRLFLVGFLGYLAIYSTWNSFEGGWCWGPRFLLPFVPVLHLAFPFLLQRYSGLQALPKVLFVAIMALAVSVNGYEFLGAYRGFEDATFGTGTIPYRWSLFLPEYSVWLNNWDRSLFLKRIPLFVLVASACFCLMVIWLPGRFSSLALNRERTR